MRYIVKDPVGSFFKLDYQGFIKNIERAVASLKLAIADGTTASAVEGFRTTIHSIDSCIDYMIAIKEEWSDNGDLIMISGAVVNRDKLTDWFLKVRTFLVKLSSVDLIKEKHLDKIPKLIKMMENFQLICDKIFSRIRWVEKGVTHRND